MYNGSLKEAEWTGIGAIEMKLFLSYRREDSQYISDRIYDALCKAFGPESVFKDIDSVPLGADFRSVIADAISKCDAVLVVIGSRWLDCRDENASRRLDQPGDFVRSEIEAAIEQGATIIPLLAEQTRMPRAADLPSTLSSIVYFNAAEIRPDPEFSNDVARLIRSLQKINELRNGEGTRSNDDTYSSTRSRLRYFCYVSRAKVAQLFSQLNSTPRLTETDKRPDVGQSEYLAYLQSLAYGTRAWSDVDPTDTIQRLRIILWHIVNRERVDDLNRICRSKAGVELKAFCFAYSGTFRVRDDRSEAKLKDRHSGSAKMLQAAGRENKFAERGPNDGHVVSGITEIVSECAGFEVNLACSFKYFSDMGGSWDSERNEWWVSPHSGNHYFFEGEVDVWFDTLIFLNGVRGRSIYGTPLFLVTGVDPHLRI
jgi:hypothetical protein